MTQQLIFSVGTVESSVTDFSERQTLERGTAGELRHLVTCTADFITAINAVSMSVASPFLSDTLATVTLVLHAVATTSRCLVTAVLAVSDGVTLQPLVYALAVGARELVTGTRGTVELVRVIGAVVDTVTLVLERDTRTYTSSTAVKLGAWVTRTKFFISAISTVLTPVAHLRVADTLFITTGELGHPVTRAWYRGRLTGHCCDEDGEDGEKGGHQHPGTRV